MRSITLYNYNVDPGKWINGVKHLPDRLEDFSLNIQSYIKTSTMMLAIIWWEVERGEY